MFLLFLDSRQKIAGMTEGALDPRLRGNDFLSVMPEIACRASMFLLFLDSRQKIAGMTEGALDPRLRGNDFLSVMPEIACRASMFSKLTPYTNHAIRD